MLSLLLFAAGGCLESNKAPVASFTRNPASGVAPLAVFFDASESMDPDGAITSYAWNFGDDSVSGPAADATATHTYTTPAMYSVTLTVVDDRGRSAEAIRNVDVTAPDAEVPIGTEIGERAPDFSLPDVRTGNLLFLEDFRGYVVLLEFWRSTCSACRSAMPGIEGLRARLADDGVVLLLVSEDVTAEEAGAFLDAQGYSATIAVHDAEEAVRDVYDVELVPRLFVIDRQGIVRYVDHPARIRDRFVTPWL